MATTDTITKSWLNSFISESVLFLLLICACCPVTSEYYESIVWSSLNPKFHFSQDDYNKDKAFFTKHVSPLSHIIMVCPNAALIPTTISKQLKLENMYENMWMVNKEEFYSCRINTLSRRLLHRCNQPDKLNYYIVNFTRLYVVSKTKQEASRNIYVIATSNGSKPSLNQTSGGHCMDEKEGISMRIKFTICEDTADPSCQIPQSSFNNKTRTCHNKTVEVMASKNTVSSMHRSEVLATCLGVALTVSMLINIVFLYLCVKRNKRRESNITEKTCQEPMKSLIIEPPNKKKPGRVSAAL